MFFCDRACEGPCYVPAAAKAGKAPEAGEVAGWLFFPDGAERVVVCEGADVVLAGAAWCARVQLDSSLLLETCEDAKRQRRIVTLFYLD